MAHPRYSVLNLFDPLACTPRRDYVDRDPRKENAGLTNLDDRLTMTAFFNRAYATNKRDHPFPVALKGRLIDIGDVTITADDGLPVEQASKMFSPLSERHYEELEGNICTPKRSQGNHADSVHDLLTVRRTPQRMALGDISLDATPMPGRTLQDRKQTFAREEKFLNAESSGPPSPLISAIHAGNTQDGLEADGTIQHFQPVSLEGSSEATSGQSRAIVFRRDVASEASRADVEVSTTDEGLASSTALLQPSDAAMLLTTTIIDISPQSPPVLPVQLTDQAPIASFVSRESSQKNNLDVSRLSSHRLSVDLQASFNWRLQCSEASFDLMNDKISFLGHDSMSSDTEDFDLRAEEERMEAAVRMMGDEEGKRKQEQVEAPQIIGKGLAGDAHSDAYTLCNTRLSGTTSEVMNTSFDERAVKDDAVEFKMARKSSQCVQRDMDQSASTSNPRFDTLVQNAARSPSPKILDEDNRSQPRISPGRAMVETPARPTPLAPPPVQALRIIKRKAVSRARASSVVPANSSRTIASTSSEVELRKTKDSRSTGLNTSPPLPVNTAVSRKGAPSQSPLPKVTHAGAKRPPLGVVPPTILPVATTSYGALAGAGALGVLNGRSEEPAPVQRAATHVHMSRKQNEGEQSASGPRRVMISHASMALQLSKPGLSVKKAITACDVVGSNASRMFPKPQMVATRTAITTSGSSTLGPKIVRPPTTFGFGSRVQPTTATGRGTVSALPRPAAGLKAKSSSTLGLTRMNTVGSNPSRIASTIGRRAGPVRT